MRLRWPSPLILASLVTVTACSVLEVDAGTESTDQTLTAVVQGMEFASPLSEAATTVGDSDSARRAEKIPVSGVDEDPAASEAFLAVAEAYEVANSGDGERWIEIRTRGMSLSPADRDAYRRRALAEYDALWALSYRIGVVGCASLGSGEWPAIDRADGPAFIGYRFCCEVIETDAFHAMSGVPSVGVDRWNVADNEIASVASIRSSPWDEFADDFQRWMQENRPGVSLGCSWPIAASCGCPTLRFESMWAISSTSHQTGHVSSRCLSCPGSAVW